MNTEDDSEDEEDLDEEYEYEDDEAPFLALALLQEVLSVYEMQTKEQRMRVLRRIEMSGALPVARDTSSYLSLLGVLAGSYMKTYEVEENAYLQSSGRNGADEEEYDEDDSLNLDGIGPDEDDELELELQLAGLTGGEGKSDPMSETMDFQNSRQEIKRQAEERMASKREDDANEKLCIGDENLNQSSKITGTDADDESEENPFALYDALTERCARAFSKTGKELMGETYCMEMEEMENEMDFLDSLVAAVGHLLSA